MSATPATTIISHWNHRANQIQLSPNEFYRVVEERLAKEGLEKVKTTRVNMSEGGIFSSKREYLQVRRGDHIFHICAAPFGQGFFVSWWLGSVEKGFWAWMAKIPLIGRLFTGLFKPLTYYRVDSALMFQSVTHAAITEALDSLLSQKGLKALSEGDRKPIMRDFFTGVSSA